jgi:hypothetical protein
VALDTHTVRGQEFTFPKNRESAKHRFPFTNRAQPPVTLRPCFATRFAPQLGGRGPYPGCEISSRDVNLKWPGLTASRGQFRLTAHVPNTFTPPVKLSVRQGFPINTGCENSMSGERSWALGPTDCSRPLSLTRRARVRVWEPRGPAGPELPLPSPRPV